MRYTVKKTKTKDLTIWHPWFALFPQRMPDGTTVWLEWIERRGEYNRIMIGDSWWTWEYRYPPK